MAITNDKSTCTKMCWAIAVAVAFLVLLSIKGTVGFFLALVLCVALGVVLALLAVKILCDGEGQGEGPENVQVGAQVATPAPKATEQAPASEPAASVAPAAAATSKDASVVKSTLLAGQMELESRKGTWKYEGDGAAAKAKTNAKAPKPAKAAKATAAATAGADDLKKLKGVGPAMEKKLHAAGVTSFAQIAGWSAQDAADMDVKLASKGRIERDDWIAQAKELASEGGA